MLCCVKLTTESGDEYDAPGWYDSLSQACDKVTECATDWRELFWQTAEVRSKFGDVVATIDLAALTRI